MFGVIFVVLAVIFGVSTVYWAIDVEKLYERVSEEGFSKSIPEALFLVPSGAILGVSCTTFVSYFLIYFLNSLLKSTEKAYGIGMFLIFCLLVFFIIFNFYIIKKNKISSNQTEEKKKNSKFYWIVSLVIIVIVSFVMIISFRSNEQEYMIGYGVVGDLAYHIAMTSSFGEAGNIPTSYRHFSGQGIRWHFMFYFFCGLLNYLGLPIDIAINIPSIIFMITAYMLAGLLATLLSKSKVAYLIAPLLIFFRSSLNGFFEVKEYIENGVPILRGIMNNSDWSSMMPYDDWGIYTLNVPTNQRHFMYGLSMILLLVILFLTYMKEMFEMIKGKKPKETFRAMFLSKEAWSIDYEDNALFIAIALVLTLPYFHGSALISLLLVLFGFAIFSKHRLSFLVLAVFAVMSSIFQTRFFSGGVGNVFKPMIHFGFVIEEQTLIGYLKYILATTGIMSIALIINIFLVKGNRRQYLILLFSFILPYLFGFIVQTSWGIHDNHKYILFSLILLDVLITWFLINLLKKISSKVIKYSLFTGLLVTLTFTGITEFVVFLNRNTVYVYSKKDAELVEWIKNNTDKTDVFLTPTWIYHDFFFSGRSVFLGWPTIGYEVGYDVDTRLAIYEELLKGCNENVNEFVKICKQNRIKYIIDTGELFAYQEKSTGEFIYNQAFIAKNFNLVYESPEDDIRVFQIYQ